MVGTTMQVYLSALIYITIGSFQTTQAAAYVGISNIFLISLFIYALAPASGGHVNSLITFATVVTGLTSFSRGVLYIVGQVAGAALAGGLLRGSFGPTLIQSYHGGGCFVDSTPITSAQGYLIESIMSFCLVFLAFGVGLDPRQATLFGPKLGPLLVGSSLGLVTFASVGIAPGYPGANVNPNRCLAYAVARRDFQFQWIWWFGPMTGALMHAIIYHIAPPYHTKEVVVTPAL
ncbi:aquaporin-like protein [Xylogone sp. PMI_703]|nr:aquaporin-like protein [Xylogone sp. PMI_703]